MKPLYIKKDGSINKVAGIAMPGMYPSEKVSYDNTESGIEATDAQGAIDEISSRTNTLKSDITNHIETTDMASRDYEAGDVFIMANGHLVRALNDIDEDTTISASDVEDITVTELLEEKANITDLDSKADKVTSAVEGNFAGLDSNGNLTDSGHKHSDYLTQHQDISGKADKVTGATNGNLAKLDANGNLADGGWSSDKTTTSATGNPISISGLKSNQLAVNPIITLEPIQAGSGTPSPSNVRAISGYDKIEVLSCGKNLLYPTPYSGSYNMAVGSDLKFTNNISTYTQDTDGITIHVSTAWYCRTFATPILKAGTYRYAVNAGDANVRATLYVTDENLIVKQVIYNQQAGGVALQTMTVTDRSRIAVTLTRNAAGDEKYKGIVVTEDDVTPPSPYEHCIKTTSISESLGQTVYGGTLDVRTGVLTVTHGVADLGSFVWAYNATRERFNSATTLPNNNTIRTELNWICERYATSINAYADNDRTYGVITIEGGWMYVRDNNYTDATTFKTAMSGVKLVYKLATPFTIQLTPHEISLLKDYAYVSTNGTSITFDYHNGELASLADVAQLGETLNWICGSEQLEVVNIPYNRFAWDSTSKSFYINNFALELNRLVGIFVNSTNGRAIMSAYASSSQLFVMGWLPTTGSSVDGTYEFTCNVLYKRSE